MSDYYELGLRLGLVKKAEDPGLSLAGAAGSILGCGASVLYDKLRGKNINALRMILSIIGGRVAGTVGYGLLSKKL